MKKKVLIIIGLLVIVCIIIASIVLYKSKNDGDTLESQSLIFLNFNSFIKQQKEYIIYGTDDTFMITEKVNFKGLNGSFAIKIPYKFIVDGIEYNGVYTMGSSKKEKTVDDKNPKYNLKEIINIKNNYETEIIITEIDVGKTEKGNELFGYDYCEGHEPRYSAQVFTDWECKICGQKGRKSDADVPIICYSCAMITDRCDRCGKLLKNI